MSLVAKHMFVIRTPHVSKMTLDDLKNAVREANYHFCNAEWIIQAKFCGIIRNGLSYILRKENADQLRRATVLRWVGIL